MIKEKLNELIEMQEEFSNPCVIVNKPKNKKQVVLYDSDTCGFDIVEDKLLFDFWEIDGFSIKIDKIKDIVKRVYEEMVISYIKLKNGNTVMLHFMK